MKPNLSTVHSGITTARPYFLTTFSVSENTSDCRSGRFPSYGTICSGTNGPQLSADMSRCFKRFPLWHLVRFCIFKTMERNPCLHRSIPSQTLVDSGIGNYVEPMVCIMTKIIVTRGCRTKLSDQHFKPFRGVF